MTLHLKSDYYFKSFASLGSTSEYLKENINELPHASVVQADIQTAGRGQGNNSWDSAKGGLYFSILFKPDNALLPRLLSFPMLMAMAILRGTRALGYQSIIKWPNDILIDGNKVAGLLVDSQIQGDDICGLILGAGINFKNNILDETLKSAAKKGYGICHLDRTELSIKELLQLFIKEIDRVYHDFANKDFSILSRQYIEESGFKQNHKYLLKNAEEYCGCMGALTPDARIILAGDTEQRKLEVEKILPF
ncbi:biotin--[acetyl-CoA-carboxylase] ligase [Candidatus Riflebacteria bacterium]